MRCPWGHAARRDSRRRSCAPAAVAACVRRRPRPRRWWLSERAGCGQVAEARVGEAEGRMRALMAERDAAKVEARLAGERARRPTQTLDEMKVWCDHLTKEIDVLKVRPPA